MSKIIKILSLLIFILAYRPDLKAQCPRISAGLVVQNDTICIGGQGIVVVESSQAEVIYTPYIVGRVNQQVGDPVSGTGKSIKIPIQSKNFLKGGHIITIIASCGTSNIPLTDKCTLYVDPQPTVANAIDVSVCDTNAVTLHGNSPAVGIGTWTFIKGYGKESFNPIDSNTVVKNINFGIPNGITIMAWNIKSGVCPVSTQTVTITNWAPVTSIAGKDQANLCSNSTDLNAEPATLGTGKWSLFRSKGLIEHPLEPSTRVTNLTPGAISILRWTVTNGSCGNFSDVQLTVPRVFLTGAVAGPDTNICENAIQLYANSYVTGEEIGIWELISGKGEIKDKNDPKTFIDNLSIGINQFKWTISNKNCKSSSIVSIKVFDGVTQAKLTDNMAVCSDSVHIIGNKPTSEEKVLWTTLKGYASYSIDTLPTLDIKFTDGNKVTLRYTISNGGCKPSSADITVTQYNAPTQAYAGDDDSICGGSTNLNANYPDVNLNETGMWSLLNKNLSINDYMELTGNAKAPVTKLPEGLTTFIWSISNPGCPPSSDTVKIRADLPPLPIADAGPDKEICSRFTTLAGNKPIKGVGEWSSFSRPIIFTKPSMPEALVSGLSTGSNTLTWTISNGACEPTSSTVIITVLDQLDEAVAGQGQLICANATNLAATPVKSGTGKWFTKDAQIKIESPESPVTRVSNLKLQSFNTFYWIVSLGDCKSKVDSVKVYVKGGLTPANAGKDTSLCEQSQYALHGNTPGIKENGKWSAVPINTSIVFNPVNGPNPVVSGLPLGKTVLTYTIQTSDTGCVNSRDELIIDVKSKLTSVYAGPDQGICGSYTVLSAYNPTTGENGIWTSSPTSANFEDPTKYNSTVDDLAPGKNVLTWSVKNSACPAVPKNVTINVTPSVDQMKNLYANDSTICFRGAVAIFAQAGFLNYRWYFNNSMIANSDNSFIYIATNPGEYRVEAFNKGECYSLSDPLTIYNDSLNDAPTIPVLTLTGSTVCDVSPISLKTDFNETYKYQWFVDGRKIFFADTYIYKPLLAGTYLTSVGRNSCSSISNAVQVSNKQNTSTPIISQTNNPLQLSTNPTAGLSTLKYQWYAKGKSETKKWLIVGATEVTYKPLYNAEYFVSIQYNDNCFVLSDAHAIAESEFVDIERANLELTDSTIRIRSSIPAEIFVQPNPTEGNFLVGYRSETNNDLTIEIFNSLGTVLDSRSFHKENEAVQVPFDGSHLAGGVYLIRIKDGSKQYSSKIFRK